MSILQISSRWLIEPPINVDLMKHWMSNALSAILLLMLLSTPSVTAQGFKVIGDVTGLDSPALLFMLFKQDGLAVEKIPVKDGRFSFEGVVVEPYLIQILILADDSTFNTTGKLTEFLIENSEIRIEGTSPNMDDVRVSGSESNRILVDYLGMDQLLSDNWQRMKADYDTALEQNETKLVNELKNSLNRLTDERVTLLKTYVKRHNSSIIGA